MIDRTACLALTQTLLLWQSRTYLLPGQSQTMRILVVGNRVHTEWQPPLSGIHSIMMGKLAQAGEGGGARSPTFTIVTITYKVAVHAPAQRAETLTLFHLYQPMLRIHDILVWIQIRIRGSMLLTNGSGFGSGPCCFRSSLTFNTPTKN
jgi:hypothetical protein